MWYGQSTMWFAINVNVNDNEIKPCEAEQSPWLRSTSSKSKAELYPAMMQ
jgi:hypothetical protein